MLSIVVPHYSDLSGLEALLASLDRELSLAGPGVASVCLVDDATPAADERLTHFAARYPWLDLQRNERNRGPAFSRNRGAARASSEWIWFVDSDVTLCPGSLAEMVRVLSDLEGFAGVMSGVQRRYESPESFKRYRNYIEYAWHPPEGTISSIDAKSFAVRRAVFESVGGFDERMTKACVEDLDLGYRLQKAGHRIFFTHRARITHRPPRFSKQLRVFFERSCSWMLMKSRHGYQFDDCQTTPRGGLTQLVSAATLGCLLAGWWCSPLLAAAPVLATLWVALELPALRVVRASGERPAFFARYYVYSLVLSVPIVAGAAVGAVGGLVRRQ